MNKELEEAIKELKTYCEVLKGKHLDNRIQAIETVLNYIDNSISKEVIDEKKNKFIEDSKNEEIFMTQSSQINASLISFCEELLKGK